MCPFSLWNTADGWMDIYCVVYLVNLLRLTFKTPKKSSVLSPPLFSSNVWVSFHTMRSVNTVRNTFFKSSLSILFRLLHFQVPRFPPLHSGAAFSSPAFSTPAVWCRVFQSRVFQSRVFSRPLSTTWLSRRTATTTRFSSKAARNRLRQGITNIRSGGLLPHKHSPDGATEHTSD